MRARYPTAFNDPDWQSMIYRGDYDMVGYTVRTCHPTGAFHAHEKLVAKKTPTASIKPSKAIGNHSLHIIKLLSIWRTQWRVLK